MRGLAAKALLTLPFLVMSTAGRTQDSHCECVLQKTTATGHEACSRADLPERCSIVFGQTQANVFVSEYVEKNGFGVPFLQPDMIQASPAPRRYNDPVNISMTMLNLPEEVLRSVARDRPAEFAGTLFWAIAASLAAPRDGDIPSAYKNPNPSGTVDEISLRRVLADLQVLMLKMHPKEISDGFNSDHPSTIRTEIDGRAYELVVARGCFEVSYKLVNVNVKTVWSRSRRNSCQG